MRWIRLLRLDNILDKELKFKNYLRVYFYEIYEKYWF